VPSQLIFFASGRFRLVFLASGLLLSNLASAQVCSTTCNESGTWFDSRGYTWTLTQDLSGHISGTVVTPACGTWSVAGNLNDVPGEFIVFATNPAPPTASCFLQFNYEMTNGAGCSVAGSICTASGTFSAPGGVGQVTWQSCPVTFSQYVTLSWAPLQPVMRASFTPPSEYLTTLASACGFTGFDWVQYVTQVPGPSALFFASDTSMSMPIIIPPHATINDPPPAGYNYPESQQPPFLGAYPFYYNPVYVADGCAEISSPSDSSCLVRITQNSTLSFYDLPSDSCLPGGAWYGLFGKCKGLYQGTGYFQAYTTQLVGVCNATPTSICSSPGMPSAPLYQWEWASNYNGTTGGVPGVKTTSSYPPDPGSGTGGVTVTSINGVQLPPVVPPTQVSTTASGLAYSRVSQTFNGTVSLTNISTTAISGPLQVLFTGMPANVSLVNATATLAGTPYLTVLTTASLASGQSITVAVQFSNPLKAAVRFTPAIYSGSIN